MKDPKKELVLIKTMGLTWYIKWVSTIVVILAVMCRSVDEIPKIYDVLLSFIGTVGWLYVGLQWKDRALIMLNAILVVMLGAGVLRFIARSYGLD